jgi:DNA replication initiation complex subunit (GINS family)
MARDDAEDFTYAALVNRWRKERSTAALTKMDGRFYETFDATLRGLRTEYEKEHASNPATPKVLILQDELMNLQRVREDIYDLRERKLVTAAVIAARGGNPDRSAMTKEEDLLFEEFLRTLRDARRNLLRRGQPAGVFGAEDQAGRSSRGVAKEVIKPLAGPPTPPEPAPEMQRAPAQPAATLPYAEPAPEAPLPGASLPLLAPLAQATEEVAASEEAREPRRLGPARVLVRVKQPVAPFVGTDLRTYRLGVEDIAAVPKEIAHALVQRGLAVALGG